MGSPTSSSPSLKRRFVRFLHFRRPPIVYGLLGVGVTTWLLILASQPSTLIIRILPTPRESLSEDENSLVATAETCTGFEFDEQKSDINTFDMYDALVRSGGHARNAKKETYGKERPKQNQPILEVFWLPFTHVDPGWLKTVDEYSTSTDATLTNMHVFMREPKNKAMRFLWAEFVFFERWWKVQNESVKSDVRRFVAEGRLELVSGSWVMTDEANPIFPVTIDNIVEGHQFLMREFGQLPTTIWSNDPFGYSNAVPGLFARSGVKRAVINRVHHGMKQQLQQLRSIPFHWRQFDDASGTLDVHTTVLPYSHYDILNNCGMQQSLCCEFDFKRMTHWSCPGPKPVPITPENVKDKATRLVASLKQMASMHEHNVVVSVHGDDFRYDMIEEWHQQHDNLKPLFEWINANDKSVKIGFGTFTDFFAALERRESAEKSPAPVLTGDFFPYVCAMGDLWTGYFSTRPFAKRLGVEAHNFIRTADLLSADVASLQSSEMNVQHAQRLQEARRALSLFQHHDAITGTAKVHVMNDYELQLRNAGDQAIAVSLEALQTLTGAPKLEHVERVLNYTDYGRLRLASLGPKGESRISVVVYNSEPRARYSVIRLLVDNTDVVVTATNGLRIRAQLEPNFDEASGKPVPGLFVLVFACHLNALGTSVFSLSSSPSDARDSTELATIEIAHLESRGRPSEFSALAVKNEFGWQFDSRFKLAQLERKWLETTAVRVELGDHGRIETIWTASSNELIDVSHSLWEYHNSRSGAYLLRVDRTNLKPIQPEDEAQSFFVVRGKVRQTAYAFWSPLIRLETRVNDIRGSTSEQVELEMRIDYQSAKQRELVMRVESPKLVSSAEKSHENLTTNDFFTDAIGLEMHRRRFYPSSHLDIGANYYPMSSAAYLETRNWRLTVLSDSPHGATSPEPGALEIMLDRMLPQDDGKGLGNEASDSWPTDLHPVRLRFVVALEKRLSDTANRSPQSSHVGHLSVATRHALRSTLLYPPFVSFGNAQTASVRSTPLLSLSCDVELIDNRWISQEERLLTLHRPYTSCADFPTPVLCPIEKDRALTFLAAYLKDRLSVNHFQKTLLNGVPGKSNGTEWIDAVVALQNMENADELFESAGDASFLTLRYRVKS